MKTGKNPGQYKTIAAGDCLLMAALLGWILPVLFSPRIARFRLFRMFGFISPDDVVFIVTLLNEYRVSDGSQECIAELYQNTRFTDFFDLFRARVVLEARANVACGRGTRLL